MSSPKKSLLKVERLRELVKYEPKTGQFIARQSTMGGRTVGKVLGTTTWPGYKTIKIDGVVYYSHRLAWFYVHGEWPDGHIDHIDGQKDNNALANLRVATPAQNAARRRTIRRQAPSRGVFPHGVGFVARLHHGGKRHYLGYFPTKEAAKAAYEEKAKEIFGAFAYKEPEKVKREVFGVEKCEICDTGDDLRVHTSWIGEPLGMLCRNCWGIVQSARCDEGLLRKAVAYLESLDTASITAPTSDHHAAPSAVT